MRPVRPGCWFLFFFLFLFLFCFLNSFLFPFSFLFSPGRARAMKRPRLVRRRPTPAALMDGLRPTLFLSLSLSISLSSSAAASLTKRRKRI